MALAASAWVTTEQELKLPEVVAPVVAVEAGAPMVGAALGDVVDEGDDDGDELHAARSTAAGAATTNRTMPEWRRMRFLDVGEGCRFGAYRMEILRTELLPKTSTSFRRRETKQSGGRSKPAAILLDSDDPASGDKRPTFPASGSRTRCTNFMFRQAM